LVEGAAEAVDVRGVVGPGMDDRAALEGTVGRAEVPVELTASLLMVLLMMGPEQRCPANRQCRRRWWQAAPRPARRGPPGGSRSSSAAAHLLLISCSSPAHLLLVSHVLIAYFPRLPTVTQDRPPARLVAWHAGVGGGRNPPYYNRTATARRPSPANNQEDLDEDRHGLARQDCVIVGAPQGQQGRGPVEISLTSHQRSRLRPPSGQAQ